MTLTNHKRIVVTGCGIISPLGCGTDIVWRRLLEGRSGIRTLPADISDGTGISVAGQVPGLSDDPEQVMSQSVLYRPKSARKWIVS
ncbi:hypothetical protein PEC301296_05610 [Pectobacterium carotovorum subsp. carotovorum]|nr:hypothetical protein PEC301296_05610 [Pectobacterium carotovorum subsp. carotovorum]